MFNQFSWFFENLVDIIKNIWPKLTKNTLRKILNEVNQKFYKVSRHYGLS